MAKRIITYVCLIFVTLVISAPTQNETIDDDVVISKVNQQFGGKNEGWVAAKNKFYKKSASEKQKLLGFKLSPAPTVKSALRNDLKKQSRRLKREVFPTAFDARVQWPACSSRIGEIRDQGNCGSCWAEGVASVLSDRYCIFKAQSSVKISVQDQVNCMPASYIPSGWSTDLCNGFDPIIGMRMAINFGVVTGGELSQSTLGCTPYSSRAYYQGLGGLNCPGTCSNTGYGTTYISDKQKALKMKWMGHFLTTMGLSKFRSYNLDSNGDVESANALFTTVEQVIMNEIMMQGSVTAGFKIYNDFFSYYSGIYQLSQATNNPYLGDHVVKIIGWGVSGTTPYWICVNSWGTSWGEAGTFRILRGSNNVNIENYINSLSV